MGRIHELEFFLNLKSAANYRERIFFYNYMFGPDHESLQQTLTIVRIAHAFRNILGSYDERN